MRVSTWFLGAAILASPLFIALGSAPQALSPAEPAVNVNAQSPTMAMRDGLSAQVAVYDAVDQTWRAPTPSELAGLSQGAAASGALRTFTLPNGGVVAELGEDSMSYLTVELQPDGTMTMDHVSAAEASSFAKSPTPQAASTMGGRDEQ